jgi:hypothetical protein
MNKPGRRLPLRATWCIALSLLAQGCDTTATNNSAESKEANLRNMMTADGRLPLNEAARRGNIERMEALIVLNGVDVKAKDNVHARGGFGCFDTVPGCYFGGYDYGGHTALHMVAMYAQSLVPQGSSTRLEAYKRPQMERMVALLLDHGADIDAKTNQGDTPLHYASWRFEYDLIELLVANGADINATDKDGQTPLAYAMDSPLYESAPKWFAQDRDRVIELIRKHGGKCPRQMRLFTHCKSPPD